MKFDERFQGKSLGRLLARNTLLNLTGQGAPLIIALLAVPYVLRGLGTERFGLLALAWAVLSYLALFDLGLGRAATKFVAEALGGGAEKRVAPIVWASVLMQSVLGCVGALMLALATPYLVETILNIPVELVPEARSTFYLLAVALPGVLVTSSLRGVLEAAQRFDLVNLLRVPFSSANFLVPVLGVVVDWELSGIVALLVLTRYLAVVAHYKMCAEVFPSLKARPQLYRREARALLQFGSWVTVSSLVSPILVHIDRFVIGAAMTITAVAYYSAPYEMITRLWIIPTSVVATLFPAFSTLLARGEYEAFGPLMRRSSQVIAISIAPVVLAVILLADDLLRLWLGPEFAQASTGVLQILAVGVLMNCLANTPYSLIQALGRPDLTAKFHLLELPIYIPVLWWCLDRWGLTGAAFAWSFRVTVDAFLLFTAAIRLSSPKVLARALEAGLGKN